MSAEGLGPTTRAARDARGQEGATAPSRQEIRAGVPPLRSEHQPDVHDEYADARVAWARVEGPGPREAQITDGDLDDQGRDADAVAETGRREPSKRIRHHAVVEEHGAVPRGTDGKLQVDVLQDSEVSADRAVLHDTGGQRITESSAEDTVDARSVQSVPAERGIAAREVALDLGQQGLAAERKALVVAQGVSQLEPREQGDDDGGPRPGLDE